jgi:hypothetical protein
MMKSWLLAILVATVVALSTAPVAAFQAGSGADIGDTVVILHETGETGVLGCGFGPAREYQATVGSQRRLWGWISGGAAISVWVPAAVTVKPGSRFTVSFSEYCPPYNIWALEPVGEREQP